VPPTGVCTAAAAAHTAVIEIATPTEPVTQSAQRRSVLLIEEKRFIALRFRALRPSRRR